MVKLEHIKIEQGWKQALHDEFLKPYFAQIKAKYLHQREQNKILYPKASQLFHAFNLTPFDKVKVVLLGQDPYHNPNQAMGLSFSVPKGIPLPPSLKNIYQELSCDLNIPIPSSGDLSPWAEQGVLLLNSILSVEAHKPQSHRHLGWEEFTDGVIRILSEQKMGLVFLLWGNFAKKKKDLIDFSKHHILQAAHPSPLARTGFLGCRHFSKTNALLQAQNKEPINWRLD